jgi:hypothetical protein
MPLSKDQELSSFEDLVGSPDDIVFDMTTAQIRITGPTNKEEKVKWDRMWDRVEDCDHSIVEVTQHIKKCRDKEIVKLMEDVIA